MRQQGAGHHRRIDEVMRVFGLNDNPPPPPYDGPFPQPMNHRQGVEQLVDGQGGRPRKRHRGRR
jgi:hypothetical protein